MDDDGNKKSRNPFRLSNPFSGSDRRASSEAGQSSGVAPNAPPPGYTPSENSQQGAPGCSRGQQSEKQQQQQQSNPPPFLQPPPEPGAYVLTTPPHAAPASPGFRSAFACLTLNMYDRIRLINFSAQEVDAVKDVVRRAWPEGIQEVRPYGASTEIKCNGYPWTSKRGHGNDDSRRMILRMLQALYDAGWVMQTALDMSKKELDKDSLFFRKQIPPPPECDWIIMSFDMTDKIKVVGDVPPDLASGIADIFAGLGLLRQREFAGDRLKIHCHGHPWYPSGTDTVQTRLMMLAVLECLERFGFSVYQSIDTSSDQEGREADVLVCNRQKDWEPGMPIWHR